MDDDIVRILVSTDNHLGYLEKDPIRGNDSFAAFEEILRTAIARKVDFLLLAGDLFHENKPSRNTLYNTLKLLQKYCLNSNDIYIHILNENNEIFNTINGKVNYENPYFSIGLPIFSIHGNHDDPLKEISSTTVISSSSPTPNNTSSTSSSSLAALDLLSINNLINYIGKSDRVDDIIITPILIKKNNTKIALYSLGAIRDERLYRMWLQKKVKFVKLTKEQDCDEFFNVFILHQNRYNRNANPVSSGLRSGSGSKNYILESMIPSWMDLVIWGNEHECQPYLTESHHGNFRILQPGSSIACSLNHSESNDFPKHMAYFEIKEKKYRVKFLPYNNVRLFLYNEISLHNNLSITLNQTKFDIDMKNGRNNNNNNNNNNNQILDLNTELLRTKTYKFDINDPKLEETIKNFCINKVNNLINLSQELLLKDNSEFLLTEKLYEIHIINNLIYEEEANINEAGGQNATTYDTLFIEEETDEIEEFEDDTNLTREKYLEQLIQIKNYLTYNLKNNIDVNNPYTSIPPSAPYFSLTNSFNYSTSSSSSHSTIASYFYSFIHKKIYRLIKKKLKYNFSIVSSNKILLKLKIFIDEFFPVINTKRFGLQFYLFLCNPSDILSFSKKKSSFFLSNKDEISKKINQLNVEEINEKNLLKYLIINGNEEEINSINMDDIINEELYLANNNLYVLKIKEMNEALDNYIVKKDLNSFNSVIYKNLNEVKKDLYSKQEINTVNLIHENIGYKINNTSSTNNNDATTNDLNIEDDSKDDKKPKKRATKSKEKKETTLKGRGRKAAKKDEDSDEIEEIVSDDNVESVSNRRSARARTNVSYNDDVMDLDDDIENSSVNSAIQVSSSEDEIEETTTKKPRGRKAATPKKVTKAAKNPKIVNSFKPEASLQTQLTLPFTIDKSSSMLPTPLTIPPTLNSNQLNDLTSFPFSNGIDTNKGVNSLAKKKIQLPFSFSQTNTKTTSKKNNQKMVEDWDN